MHTVEVALSWLNENNYEKISKLYLIAGICDMEKNVSQVIEHQSKLLCQSINYIMCEH